VVSPYLVVTRGWGVVAYLPVTLVAIGLLTVFASGVAMWFAGVNVVFRDLQELFVVIFLVWFYATPVLYPLALVRSRWAGGGVEWLSTALQFNPMTWFVELFRAPLFGKVIETPGYQPGTDGVSPVTSLAPGLPSLLTLGVSAALAVVALVVGYTVFQRRARTFAKEV
jgi:ABC-type polysaccharide/polyol phosphate export permease